jgi:hypothetical protein
MEGREGTIIIGGEPTPEKLLAIDTLIAYTTNIFLLGRTGFAFYCTMHGIQHEYVTPTLRRAIQ